MQQEPSPELKGTLRDALSHVLIEPVPASLMTMIERLREQERRPSSRN